MAKKIMIFVDLDCPESISVFDTHGVYFECVHSSVLEDEDL